MTNTHVVTVGIDGSETSTVALEWAAREAARRGAALRVIHAYTNRVYGADFGVMMAYPAVDLGKLHESHEQVVTTQVDAIRTTFPTLEIEIQVTAGGPVSTIVDGAKDSDLVVVGSHGCGSFAALVIGSVARSVAHRAPCPVVLVPNKPLRPTVNTIIVGTDGSPASDAAMDWADQEAKLWDAQLTVAHACYYPYAVGHVATRSAAALMEVDAMMLLTEAGRRLDARHGDNSEVPTELLTGAPATALVEAAANRDLLVIGAHGRGAFKAAVLGSTSNHVIHHAQGPVAMVHTPKDH
jgi:nucleotide-binding universal stress UspA family protein